MTNIEQKALELVNKVARERGYTVQESSCPSVYVEALCRAIERHEAFRQEVSDAIEEMLNTPGCVIRNYIGRFIIAKPDHIRSAALDIGVSWGANDSDSFRAALAKRGGRIVFDD